MSALARSLLALAAAALLHGACADSVVPVRAMWHCNQISKGLTNSIPKRVANFHIDQTDYVFDLPSSKCGPIGAYLAGTNVLACDNFGVPPKLQFLDSNRVRVSCSWSDGQRCPQGLDISVDQFCQPIYPTS